MSTVVKGTQNFGIFEDSPVYARFVGNALDVISAYNQHSRLMIFGIPKIVSIDCNAADYNGLDLDEYEATVKITCKNYSGGEHVFTYTEHTGEIDGDPDLIHYELSKNDDNFVLSGSIVRRSLGMLNNAVKKQQQSLPSGDQGTISYLITAIP